MKIWMIAVKRYLDLVHEGVVGNLDRYDFLQFRADVLMLFCEEWSAHVAFDNADHVPDFERTDL